MNKQDDDAEQEELQEVVAEPNIVKKPSDVTQDQIWQLFHSQQTD